MNTVEIGFNSLFLLLTFILCIPICTEYVNYCYDDDSSIGISCSNLDIRT